VRSGVLGTVGVVQATFSFSSNYAPGHRLWANEFAGGGILDVGGYPVSLARLIAGAIDGQPFFDPVQVTGTARLHPETGVDVYAAATLKFANGVVAQVATGIGLTQDNSVRIYGDKAWLHVRSRGSRREGGATTMFLHRPGSSVPVEIVVENDAWLYGLEADAFAAALASGAREVPQMAHCRHAGQHGRARCMASGCRSDLRERAAGEFRHTHARRPLARRTDAAMRYVTISDSRGRCHNSSWVATTSARCHTPRRCGTTGSNAAETPSIRRGCMAEV